MAWNGVTVAFVAAVARNGVIGRDGAIPWRIPADMRFFKDTTMGRPIVMGRKTYESFPRRPLPGRTNIVVTRQPDWSQEGAVAVLSLEDGLDRAAAAARAAGQDTVMVIGGAEIYRAALPHADRLYLTRVGGDCEGDTVFPALDAAQWTETRREPFADDPKATHSAVLCVLDRV